MTFLLLLACGGGVFSPASIEGDASSPVLTWDDSLMMAVDIAPGDWDVGTSGAVWAISAAECEDVIASPLTVGEVPEGVEETMEAILPLEEGNHMATFYRCIDQGYGDGPQKTPVGDIVFTVEADGSLSF